jgi:hypothetical protein
LRLLGNLLLHRGDVSSRRGLQEAIETFPHSFYVLIILVIVFLIILIGGVFLRTLLTACLVPSLLERL